MVQKQSSFGNSFMPKVAKKPEPAPPTSGAAASTEKKLNPFEAA